MADDIEKDNLIRNLGHELADLQRSLLQERQAACEEHGRLCALLGELHDSLADADARARVRTILAEMSGDAASGSAAGSEAGPAPTHDTKSTLH